MEAALEKQNKIYASVSTLLMFILLLLIVFFIKFYTPIPPFPETGIGEIGLEVNFGNTDNGSGTDYSHDLNNVNNNDQDKKEVTPTDPDNSSNDKVISEDDPNNTYVKNDKPKKDIKKDVTKDQQPDKNVQDAFKNFNDNDHSDGSQDKNGNQGDPNGGDSKSYTGNSPTGNGGNGGPGVPKVNLKGRSYLPPEKITDFSEEGTIVVDIIVDKHGKVTFAEVNRGRSINPNYVLCAKARQAALTTKFNESPDGTLEQKGSITFEFKLK
jgi:protein TonB